MYSSIRYLHFLHKALRKHSMAMVFFVGPDSLSTI